MTLRVLILNESGGYVAQCLEHDIAAQGSSVRETLTNFLDVLRGQVEFDLARNRTPLSNKKAAPPWYWQALKDADRLESPKSFESLATEQNLRGFGFIAAEAWVR
jgi:hypothetical protein